MVEKIDLTDGEVDDRIRGLNLHGEPRYVRVRDLIVDERYQRPLNQRRVRQIADEFDPYAVGILYVSQRLDGTNVLLDGQHRKAALVRMRWDDQLVPAFVYQGLTVEEEAHIFRVMNEQRARPTPLDLFRTRITERDPQALDMVGLLGAAGLRPGYGNDPGTFRAISAAMKVYDLAGRNGLRDVLQVLHGAWPTYADPLGVSADFVLGVGLVLAEYEGEIDVTRLIVNMAKEMPSNLIARARNLRATFGGSVPSCVAITLVALYNKGLRTHRLDEWTARPWRRNPLIPRSQDPTAQVTGD